MSSCFFIDQVGHNLGMYHDFGDEHGGPGNPCDNGLGFMGYGSAPDRWSDCSRRDFEAQYANILGQGLPWCMPSNGPC